MRKLDIMKPLLEAGVWLVPVKPGTKQYLWSGQQSLWPKFSLPQWEAFLTENPNANVKALLGPKSPLAEGAWLTVIDVDDHDKAAQDADYEEMREWLFSWWPMWDALPRVMTPSGGQHIYAAIDTPNFADGYIWQSKGEHLGKPRLRVELKKIGTMVPPSSILGKEYTWLIPFDVPLLLRHKISWPEEDWQAGHGVPTEDHAKLTYTKLQDLILELPAEWVDERELWFGLGCAIYTESDGASWGLDLWDEASQLGSSYKYGETKKMWPSIGRYSARRKTVGTLFMAAKDCAVERRRGKKIERIIDRV